MKNTIRSFFIMVIAFIFGFSALLIEGTLPIIRDAIIAIIEAIGAAIADLILRLKGKLQDLPIITKETDP